MFGDPAEVNRLRTRPVNKPTSASVPRLIQVMRQCVLQAAVDMDVQVVSGKLHIHPWDAWPITANLLRTPPAPGALSVHGAFDFEFMGLPWQLGLSMKVQAGRPVIEVKTAARTRRERGAGPKG